MKTALQLFFIINVLISCQDKVDPKYAYVPDSSGSLNHVTVVMLENDWNSNLGERVRNNLQQIYEGLPLDEPEYTLNYLNPKAFSGFARQGRNVVWFKKDSISGFQLSEISSLGLKY